MQFQFRRGQALIMFAVMLPIFMAFAGLAVDVTYAFMVKAALVTATDSAVLAGTRAIPLIGSNPYAVTNAVDRTFRANLPANGLVTGTPTYSPSPPVVTVEGSGARSLSLTGRAQSPTVFLRVFGINSFSVSSYARGIRRDVNVALVLDRSGSITQAGAWGSVRDGAKFFVEQFDDTRDKLALVTFGTGGAIDYPVSGRPTTNFQTAAKASIDTMPQPNTSNHTNSAWGLYLAYQALKTLNDSTAENIIVYFTDGRSTAFPGNFTVKTAGKPHCDSSPREAIFSSQNDNASPYGIFRRDLPAAGSWPTPDHVAFPDCYNNAGNGNGNANYSGPDLLTAFPESWMPPVGPVISIYNSSVNAIVTPYTVDGPTVGKIGDNMLVNVAQVARQDGLRIRIFAIGLGGSPGSPAREDVLKRVANTAPYTDPAQPIGLEVYAPNQTQLMEAFKQVASSISRLAQ